MDLGHAGLTPAVNEPVLHYGLVKRTADLAGCLS